MNGGSKAIVEIATLATRTVNWQVIRVACAHLEGAFRFTLNQFLRARTLEPYCARVIWSDMRTHLNDKRALL